MSSPKVAGCSFLLSELSPGDAFFPEDFTGEHKLIAQTAAEFSEKEVLPNDVAMGAKQFDVTRALIKKSADLGLLQADMPEEYGGLDLGKVISALIIEKLATGSSYFLTAFTDHVGIGSLPLQLFGDEKQKGMYLTKLADGSFVGAYGLTESHAGSDVASIRTKARLSPDGKNYILNGSKMWITNAGFADLFGIFAKVHGKVTAFLVPRNTPGFTIGAEEHKLGLHGSSTCPLEFVDAIVPVENMLGQVGEGFKIAMNVLNLGRFKLSPGCVGSTKALMELSKSYAKGRMTFGKPISTRGLIRNKFGKMVTKVWLMEAVVYRTADLLDKAMHSVSATDIKARMAAVAEYATECSINKVFASEVLNYVTNECVQILGGMGYADSGGISPARAYRDARINTIWEGTNEINRMLTGERIFKADRSFPSGKLQIFEAAQKYLNEIALGSEEPMIIPSGVLWRETLFLRNLKKLTVLLFGASAQKFMLEIKEEQEVLGSLANLVNMVFALESGILRANKIIERGNCADVERAIVKTAAQMFKLDADKNVRRIIERIGGIEAVSLRVAREKLLDFGDVDEIGLKRFIADSYLNETWKFL
ncbi:MAG: acyl-CoA dehydrogenase family protein [Candidatus Liptonbacteria bacterium]|nr:acyl-CoA dehydrogenase family protein [Candidatus Liptonbacteria bacterium]